MKSKRSLLTVLVGLAMLATPITAAARDNHDYARNNSHASRASHSFTEPARSFASARNVPAAVTRNVFRNHAVAAAPGRTWGTVDEYRNYGGNYARPGYYAAPAYPVAAPYAVAPYYGGGAPGYAGVSGCTHAQGIMNIISHDRATGHPAAAYDVFKQNQGLLQACGGGVPATSGLFSGLGGLGGAPAYNNYGGYNGGYGQPYGGTSMLAPLIQQFVR